MSEICLLVESAGGEIAHIVTASRPKPQPGTFVGSGKLDELAQAVKKHAVGLLVVNQAITPIQERNLERALECRVLDRTGLILDIFAQRARTHEGKLQVELAQLRHLSTRLVRGWTHLERQKGGIGLRGPGETQLETDRRLIGGRIRKLKERLVKVSAQRALRRVAREKVPLPTVSLVGYTNAGKSTLFNRMTDAGVYVEDQLFATLDTTMRRLNLPEYGKVILSDTVGFVRDLPHTLVQAFQSTLEEVSSANVLLHVVDAAGASRDDNINAVQKVLDEIDAGEIPQILVYNKADLLEPEFRGRALNGFDGKIAEKVWVSAHDGSGLNDLLDSITRVLSTTRQSYQVCLPVSAGALRAKLYERGSVKAESQTDIGDWQIEIELSDSALGWLRKQTDVQEIALN
ncbi:MAG: GTPase HflX [Proteobacteria bacterium]|nr:GTPase HflX [Pseudomonadota bacterium]